MSVVEPGTRRSALGEILDLLGEFFDLLCFFDKGNGECGIRIRFLDLVLEVGDHFIKFSDIGAEFLLIGTLNGLFVGPGDLRAVESRGNMGIGSVGGGTRLRCRAYTGSALTECESRPEG